MSRAIVVSPHLDDAALSCGGGITRLTRAGASVAVVTIFTADQPLGEPLSPLARRSHASWGVGDQPFAIRRAEDRSAIQLLGAEAAHLGLLDAIYRRSRSGEALYTDPLAVPAPDDVEGFLPRLAASLRDRGVGASPDAVVFCPAGTGGHVDHVLTRRAVEQITDAEKIVYYDEYPYSSRTGAQRTAADNPGTWPLCELPLSAEELQVRIGAIGSYTSQLRGLFPSTSERLREIASARIPVVGQWVVRKPDTHASRARMAARVSRDTASSGGERYWWSPRRASPFERA